MEKYDQANRPRMQHHVYTRQQPAAILRTAPLYWARSPASYFRYGNGSHVVSVLFIMDRCRCTLKRRF